MIDGKREIQATRVQPTRYMMAKLHKKVIKFRSITTCYATTTEGIARFVHVCFAGMLPTLHAMWREVGTPIGILSKGCWISKGGVEIIDIAQEADRARASEGLEQGSAECLPHIFQTFDFVGMYTNIPMSVLVQKMERLLGLVFDYQERENGYKSIFFKDGFKNSSPIVRDENCN